MLSMPNENETCFADTEIVEFKLHEVYWNKFEATATKLFWNSSIKFKFWN